MVNMNLPQVILNQFQLFWGKKILDSILQAKKTNRMISTILGYLWVSGYEDLWLDISN